MNNENEMETIQFKDLKPCYNDACQNILLPFLKSILESKKYKVYSSAKLEDFSYFIVSNGLNLVYVQKDYFSGVSISTKHHPNTKTGTGHQIIREDIEPTLEKLNSVFNTHYKDNTYYININDYLKLAINRILILRKVIL